MNVKNYLLEEYESDHQYSSTFDVQFSHDDLNVKTFEPSPVFSRLNTACSLINYIVLAFGIAVTTILLPFILMDQNYYNLKENAGIITAIILILQLIVKVSLAVPYRRLANKFGVNVVVCLGALSVLIGSLLIPLSKAIVPFVLINLLFSNGSSAITAAPLSASYIQDKPKAKASLISATFIGLSAIIANLFLKILFYHEVSLGICYNITGIIVFFTLVINSFGLAKTGSSLEKSDNSNIQNTTTPTPDESFRETMNTFKSNGWLLITLVIQVLASCDFFLFFTFMTMFLKSLNTTNDDLHTNIFINNIQTLVFGPSLLFNIFYGFCADRELTTLLISAFALGGGACSFIFLTFSQAAYDWPTIAGAILMSATVPGLFVISGHLGIKHFPPENRKMSIAVVGFFGILSYLIIAVTGGLLYDYWIKDGIFYVCAGLMMIGLVAIIIIYKTMISDREDIKTKNGHDEIEYYEGVN